MPCVTYEPDPDPLGNKKLEKERARNRKEFGVAMSDENTKKFLMQLACSTLEILDNEGIDLIDTLDLEERDWWKWHQDRDSERIRKEALAKLSPKERIALGV